MNFKYFRMSLKSSDKLLNLLQEEVGGLETNMRRCVPPAKYYVEVKMVP
jgi:hypothetical protein